LTKLKSEITATQTTIQATRRQVAKEIEEHERLSGLKFEADSRNAKLGPELAAVAEELSEIRAESSEKLNFSSSLRCSIEEESSRGSALVAKRESLFAGVVKLKARKDEVEKAVLANLKASEAGKAHARHLNRLKSELKDAARTLELQAAELENAISASDLAKAAAQAEIDNFKQAVDGLNDDLQRQNENLRRLIKVFPFSLNL
jgi:chromosome segregation ATPase